MPTPANAINEATTGIAGFTGTAFTATPVTNHALLVGGATSSTLTNVGPSSTSGQVLQSAGASSDPAFSTATYPATTTINQILYSSANNTVTGLATANRAVITTGSTGVPVATALATDGQLIIGSTSGAPAAATLTAGTNISITNASNSITINATGGGGGTVPTLTYIGSGTASGGTVDFTGLSSSYKGYRFYMSALTPSTTARVLIRCSTDNGSTYDSSSVYVRMAAAGVSNSNLVTTGFSTALSSTSAVNGYVDVYFNNIANSLVTFESRAFNVTSTDWASGVYLTLANVNAVRFVASTGNLSSGTIYQYGIS